MESSDEVHSVPVKGEKLKQIAMPFVVPEQPVLHSQECSVQHAEIENS